MNPLHLTNIKAMLATDAEPRSLNRLMMDDEWWMEPKYDGVRTLVHVADGPVFWLNRNAELLTKPVPVSVTEALLNLRLGGLVLDGEIVDGVLFAFDIPRVGSTDLLDLPLSERREVLEEVVASIGCPDLRLARRALGRVERQAMISHGMREGWEGVIFKWSRGYYFPGRRTSVMRKLKFVHTADFVISDVGIDGKANAALSLWDGGTWVEVGHCSLLGKPAVEFGDIVEVRFLCTGPNGRIVQPRMVRIRADKSPAECTTEQLRGTQIGQPRHG